MSKPTEAASLAVFRVFFGLLMSVSLVRFWANGWIEKLYLEPSFFFSYYGFEWVKPLGDFTYVIFVLCFLSAIGVMLGCKYRLSIVVFFVSFTYIELMDKTTYLNHYYFVSLISFLMIFLPAGAYFSWDAFRDKTKRFQKIPAWTILSIKLLLAIVYFYAGLAKLNSDWMLEALPLKIWLPSKTTIPVIGPLFANEWIAYAFSWGGAAYDLLIPFLLFYKRTRVFAFIMVVIFHVLTRILFPIGMFPYIMIVATLIFFDHSIHHKILTVISRIFKITKERFNNGASLKIDKGWASQLSKGVVLLFFLIQIVLPFRYLLYPGELFWTEEGYRFSWRVMLMEKSGYAQFKVKDGKSERWFYVDNTDFLTPFQEKQMSFQPDFMLEYAHYLEEHFAAQGYENIEIYVESYVALNGRPGTPIVSPDENLLEYKESFKPKTWITPFKDDIKGL